MKKKDKVLIYKVTLTKNDKEHTEFWFKPWKEVDKRVKRCYSKLNYDAIELEWIPWEI